MVDAVVIIAFKSPIIFKSVESVIKHTPSEIPIFLIDQARPDMVMEKKRMREALARFDSRVIVEELFVHDRIAFAPWAIVKLLEKYPDIENILKVDDDVILASDVYTGAKEAYAQKENTLFSCALCPIQIWGLEIIKERCGIQINEKLLNPETMLKSIVRDSALATELWKQTTPPSRILKHIKKEPRFVEVPLFRKDTDSRGSAKRADFMINQYYASRETIIECCSNLNGIDTSDEINYQRIRQKTGIPVIMDTWSLAYHFSGAPWFEHAWKCDWPIIRDVVF